MMTVRDVRQRWPEAERSLETEGEIIITRDGKPIARLLPVEAVAPPPGKRFDPEEMKRWREEVWGDQIIDTLTPLLESREERVLVSESALAALAAQDEKRHLAAQTLKADSKLLDEL